MVAHYHRLATGKGQHVDVSGQQAVARVLSEAPATWGLNHINVVRRGSYRGMGGERQLRTTWPAKDGFVSYFVMGGVLGERTNSLFRWMASEGFRPIPQAPSDWREVDAGKLSEEVLESVEGAMAAFFLTHTKRGLYQGASDRGILMFPVGNADDAFSDPQLAARDFFTDIDHPKEGPLLPLPRLLHKVHRLPPSARDAAPPISVSTMMKSWAITSTQKGRGPSSK